MHRLKLENMHPILWNSLLLTIFLSVCASTTDFCSSTESPSDLVRRARDLEQDAVAVSNRVSNLDSSVNQFQAEAALLEEELAMVETLLSNKLEFVARVVPVPCKNSTLQGCHYCSNGTVMLQCKDGLNTVRPIALCDEKGYFPPGIIHGTLLSSKNETMELYSLPAATSCCYDEHGFSACYCDQCAEGSDHCIACESG